MVGVIGAALTVNKAAALVTESAPLLTVTSIQGKRMGELAHSLTKEAPESA